VTGALVQAVKEVGDIMNVTMLPFGNAKLSPSGALTCQHGPEECLANSYEQCLIDVYPSFDTYFPFYECMESNIDSGWTIKKQASECAASTGLDLARIEACVFDKARSAALQKKFRNMTPSTHKYVPWVVVNGVHSASDGQKLIAEVCAAYEGPRTPIACVAASSQPVATEATDLCMA